MFLKIFVLLFAILQQTPAEVISDSVNTFAHAANSVFSNIKQNKNACCEALRNLQPTKIFTPDPGPNYVRHYQYYEASSTKCLSFKVRADKDAHISLVSTQNSKDPMIEIVIAGWGGSKSVIRKWAVDHVEKWNIANLNINEDLGFWITWEGGKINVGKQGEKNSFMSWNDPQPFDIKYFGLSTCGGSSGTWIIEEPHCPNLSLYQINMQILPGTRFTK